MVFRENGRKGRIYQGYPHFRHMPCMYGESASGGTEMSSECIACGAWKKGAVNCAANKQCPLEALARKEYPE